MVAGAADAALGMVMVRRRFGIKLGKKGGV
jgi:hypothetical protein